MSYVISTDFPRVQVERVFGVLFKTLHGILSAWGSFPALLQLQHPAALSSLSTFQVNKIKKKKTKAKHMKAETQVKMHSWQEMCTLIHTGAYTWNLLHIVQIRWDEPYTQQTALRRF